MFAKHFEATVEAVHVCVAGAELLRELALIAGPGPQANPGLPLMWYYIPCSRDNPKILGGYDTEIVGDRIA